MNFDKIKNSASEEDKTRLDVLKKELQRIDEERDLVSARRYFAKHSLEGERPTKFFCSMNKKLKNKTQFETLHVKEMNERGQEMI